MGAEPTARSAELRTFVVDRALAVVVDAFHLEGLVLAGGGASLTSRFLATRLPPSWSPDSPVLFELYGRLHAALGIDAADGRALFRGRAHRTGRSGAPGAGPGRRSAGGEAQVTTWQASIGAHRALLARLTDGGGPVVAAAVRRPPFSEGEAEALTAVVGSLVSALRGDASDPGRRSALRSQLVVSVEQTGQGATARVDLPAGPAAAAAGARHPAAEPRSGAATAADPVSAVARAAAASRPPWEVMFAGSSAVAGRAVTIVVVADGSRLRLGYAVGPGDDVIGPAEAVLTAVD